jgi:hypothetical protein
VARNRCGWHAKSGKCSIYLQVLTSPEKFDAPPTSDRRGCDRAVPRRVFLPGGQSSQTYDEFIYQFAGKGTASSFIRGLRSAYRRCHSYTDVESGVTVRTTYDVADVAPVDGGQAIQVTVTASASSGTVAGEVLYVLSGNEIYGVVRAGALTTIPARPAARKVIEGMMEQVQQLTS